MSDRYPVFVDLVDRPCLVVGGGAVGERKVGGLVRCGARVTVVAPEITSPLEAWVEAGSVTWVPREFKPVDLDGMVLAFAATSVPAVNGRVREEGRRRGIWVNLADDPAASDFHVPATLVRGGLTVGVATGGVSPALAAWVRDRIARVVPEEVGELVALARTLRDMTRADAVLPLLEEGLLDDLVRGDRQTAVGKVESRVGVVAGLTEKLGYSQRDTR